MKKREKLLFASIAAGLLGILTGCENATLSTAQTADRLSVLESAQAADVSPIVAHDAMLAARLADRLQSDPETRDVTIFVSVSDGRARLSGFVENAATKLRAGALATETTGIVSVENRLILRYRANVKDDPIGDARVYL